MLDWLHWVFSDHDFVTRGRCGHGWDPWLITVNQLSHAVTAISFFAVVVTLVWLYAHRPGLPRAAALIQFASFTFLCALTHLSDVLVFWWAPYRLYTMMVAALALVSATVALSLPWAAGEATRLAAESARYAGDCKRIRQLCEDAVAAMEVVADELDRGGHVPHAGAVRGVARQLAREGPCPE